MMKYRVLILGWALWYYSPTTTQLTKIETYTLEETCIANGKRLIKDIDTLLPYNQDSFSCVETNSIY